MEPVISRTKTKLETKDNQKVYRIFEKNNTATFNIPSRNLHKTIKVKEKYYDISMLNYLFQVYPFGHEKRIQFNLVMDGRRGSPVGSFAMYVMETWQENIKVPFGSYDCYRLEMGITGMASIFSSKYKYYFWYTVNTPHILVKFKDKQSGLCKLLEIDVKED